jgi:hypothetical protein
MCSRYFELVLRDVAIVASQLVRVYHIPHVVVQNSRNKLIQVFLEYELDSYNPGSRIKVGKSTDFGVEEQEINSLGHEGLGMLGIDKLYSLGAKGHNI